MKYKKAKLFIEGMDGVVTIDGWAREDDYWNGWSYVLMNKENADKLASKIPEVIKYDKKTDSYKEVLSQDSNREDELDSWSGYLSEQAGEHVYCIGSGSWCWSHKVVNTYTDKETILEFKDKLQTVYGEMLENRGITHGDIEPMLAIRFDDAEAELASLVNKWLKSLEGK